MNKHDQEYIKHKNKSMVLDVIRNRRPISRADIAKITGMSPTSVSRIVADLCQAGIVKETEQFSSGVGRKATLLDIDASSVLTVGIELDKTEIKIGVVDFDGRIAAEHTVSGANHDKAPQAVADTIAAKLLELVRDNGINRDKIIGVGIGIPGIIDVDSGTVVFSSQLGWKNVAFLKLVEERVGIPTTIDNDLNVKALGESIYGHVNESRKTVLIGIGSGVGSTLVIDGEIYRGETNIAGEIGHFNFDPNGMLCECGKRGCLQTYIAEYALIQEANNFKKVSRLSEIFHEWRAGEPWAISIIDRACTYIAVTVSNVVCMYNPDTIVLSGNFIEQHPHILEAVRAKLDDFIWEPFRGTFKLVLSKFAGKSVMIGAASLALNLRLDYELQTS
ncbi:hypothetical protein SD70_03120 [Gordoniibacillus kamchatkensis]|uniref:HTH crp-type domain-containing protein n=1 Tax=Gordoniibacillus kamchatkensis TaxID=1590651 RepID=A0ABR5AMG8_9BACL|nr:hypothetical protein SD70_03120 [Paenibacillus sp. VKM B-2647]